MQLPQLRVRDPRRVRHQREGEVLRRKRWERDPVDQEDILEIAAGALGGRGVDTVTSRFRHRNRAGVMDSGTNGSNVGHPLRREAAERPPSKIAHTKN